MKKIILVVLDGAADLMRPSPLQLAKKPNLDYMAAHGICGLMDNEITGKDFSEAANFNILGYTTKPERGYVEAVGAGIEVREHDVCFRANFATVTGDFTVVDRRAGREELYLDELASELDGMRVKDCETIFVHTTGHRAVLVLRGEELSEKISGTDPKREGERVKKSFPLIPEHHPEFPAAKRTAKILNQFTEQSYRILSGHELNRKRSIPANIILSRNPGRKIELESFEKKYGLKAACVTAVNGTIGVARILGMDYAKVGNGLTTTDLGEKLKAVLEFLKTHDFVFLHIKGTDIAAHDRKFEEKRRFIERIDREIFAELAGLENAVIAVTCDHITSSLTGEHALGYVPLLIYGTEERDGVNSFDEESVRFGDMGIVRASQLMERLISFRG